MNTITFKSIFSITGLRTMTHMECVMYADRLRELRDRGLITEYDYKVERISMYEAERKNAKRFQ